MIGVSQVLVDVRDVGKSVVSTNRDIQLLLSSSASSDSDQLQRVKHARDLVDNIISLLTFFTALDRVNLDRSEELLVEVKRIEVSCFGLKSILSQSIENLNLFREQQKQVRKFSQIINESANRVVTISLVAKEPLENLVSEVQDVCYANKLTCEQHCDGSCYQDVCTENPACPEYTEVFTESALTHVESGTEEEENRYWHKPTDMMDGQSQPDVSLEISINPAVNDSSDSENNTDIFTLTNYSTDGNPPLNLFQNHDSSRDSQNRSDIYSTIAIHENETLGLLKFSKDTTDYSNNTYNSVNEEVNHKSDINDTGSYDGNPITDSVTINNDSISNSTESPTTPTDGTPMYVTEFPSSVDESPTSPLDEETTKTKEYANEVDHTTETSTYSYYDSYTSGFSPTYDTTTETTTETSYTTEDVTTPSYETTTQDLYKFSSTYDTTTETTTETCYTTEDVTTPSYETTTQDLYKFSSTYDTTTETTTETSYTTEDVTTPSYETTTQDLYKFSQDIYSVAQDLSTKSNEISSMTSDISSKISNINSIMSDINSYDDDELSKKVQSVNKLTQDMNSKTSEISSLCSSMSSLSSDISSASSDIPSADRSNVLRTSPWQKIAAKGQELVAAAQGVVSASQEILHKMDAVLATTSVMVVGSQVAIIGYDITAKTQLVISETLGLVSAVIDLINIVDS
ncbi:hypothetical protein J6590_069463 [Homalodisca vitripennis]|nr:hypothetical protein J6590_069463 [Homalodisca vitripennis]